MSSETRKRPAEDGTHTRVEHAQTSPVSPDAKRSNTTANPFLKKDSGNTVTWDDIVDDDEVEGGVNAAGDLGGKGKSGSDATTTSSSTTTSKTTTKDSASSEANAAKIAAPKVTFGSTGFGAKRPLSQASSAFGKNTDLPFAAKGITQSKLGTFSAFGSWKRAASNESEKSGEAEDLKSAEGSSARSTSVESATSLETPASSSSPAASVPAIKPTKSVFGSGYKTSSIGFGSMKAKTDEKTNEETKEDAKPATITTDAKIAAPPEWMRRKSAFGAFGSAKTSAANSPTTTTSTAATTPSADKAETISEKNENETENSETAKDETAKDEEQKAQPVIQTGEEDDKTVFESRAKLFIWESVNDADAEWHERGRGMIKINVIGAKRDTPDFSNMDKVNEITDLDLTHKSRILLRMDKSLRLALNTPIFSHTNARKVSEKFVEFLGVQPEEPTKIRKFLVQLKNADVSLEFESVVAKLSTGSGSSK